MTRSQNVGKKEFFVLKLLSALFSKAYRFSLIGKHVRARRPRLRSRYIFSESRFTFTSWAKECFVFKNSGIENSEVQGTGFALLLSPMGQRLENACFRVSNWVKYSVK